MTNISPEKCAYFAGHFDGEGTVFFQKKGMSCQVRIAVNVSYLPILKEYQCNFGGTIGRGRINNSKKLLYAWNLRRMDQCLWFIEKIIVFSREKKEQLELARDFLVNRIACHN